MSLSVKIVFLGLIAVSCKSLSQSETEFTKKREMMVASQIESRGITDPRVLNAMRKVERHLFVPPDQVSRAYGDYPLPIGYGQTISQPYIVAFMTEALDLTPAMKVLEIGTGSGYQAAVLAEICDTVYTVELVPSLAQKAKNLLLLLGYKNIKVRTGDGYQGWIEHSPFQAIIVTCSPTRIPAPLIDQLDEGGRMIIPVGERYSQELIILVKKNDRLTQKAVLPVSFVPMLDQNQNAY